VKFIAKEIKDCYEIFPREITDLRGKLVKTFHEEIFKEKGLENQFVEEYFSVSQKGVLRGLHVQLPPQACKKLLYCINGRVLDVLVDLRINSPCYGKPICFEVSADKANVLYIPEGIAHGFYVLSDTSTIVCKMSKVYAPEYDTGISWKSVDIWPTDNPILSEKDKNLPLLKNFNSPFEFDQK